MSENREHVARKLAEKDKREWDKLEEIMQNAYLHNADEDIKARAAIPVEKGGSAVAVSCKVCGDKAYLDNKPCPECNPVGLPAEQVHPGATPQKIVEPDDKAGTTVAIGKVNLCDTCRLEYPICDSPNVEYGDGQGKDNIIKCDIYSPDTVMVMEEAAKVIEAKPITKNTSKKKKKA